MAIYLGENKITLAGTNDGYMINGRLLVTKNYSFPLSATNFSSLTPSTTAQALTLPATTYSSSSSSVQCIRIGEAYDGIILNRDIYDYIVFTFVQIDHNYGSNNMNSTLHTVRTAYGRDYHYGKSYRNIDANTGILTTAVNKGGSYIGSTNPLLYQKANNTYAITTNSYGIYGTASAGFNSTNNKDYLYIQASGFYVKASDSYCPVASLQQISPADTIITISCEVYEGDHNAYGHYFTKAYDLVTNH